MFKNQAEKITHFLVAGLMSCQYVQVMTFFHCQGATPD